MKRIIFFAITIIFVAQAAWAARARIDEITRDPYVSALAIDADTGKILSDENSEAIVYPASVLKMMVLLVIIERLENGQLKLKDMVQVTREAAQMGGSQVYLDPKEQFSIEDLLYALAIQSANDAAVALAIHVAGSKEGFVALMTERAAELGMKDTRFYSVHGLPPSKGQKPDITTARDLAILGRKLAGRPEIFKYTAIKERDFRGGEFVMRTHNHLLSSVDGCDGFKTGYFKAAGFSIMATAERRGVRIIAIVMGSKDRKVRDAKAKQLIAEGFSKIPPKAETEIVVVKPEKNSEKVVEKVSPEPDPGGEAVEVEEKREDDSSFFDRKICEKR